MKYAALSPRLLVGLWILVVTIKLGYLLSYMHHLPFLWGPIFDSQVYLQQAYAVVHGNFGDATLLAFSPLYGYYLALLSAAKHPLWPVLGQFALGCMNLLLLYRLGRRVFDAPIYGLLSAALYFGYGTLLFYESKILSETLGITLGLWTLSRYLSPRFFAGSWSRAVLCGATLALAILARASLLFCAPFFVLCALCRFHRGEGTALWARFSRSAGLCLGLGLVLGFNGLWTQQHSGFFVPVIFVSQTVARTTGQPWTGKLQDLNPTGTVGPWDVVHQAQARMQKLRSGQVEEPSSAPRIDLWGLVRGAPSKLYGTLRDVEISSYMYSYYGERTDLWIFALLPISFGMLLVLGLCGALVLLRRDPWMLMPYLPFLLGPLVTTILYHPSSRYRLAMVLPTFLLGALGAVTLGGLPIKKRLFFGGPVALLLVWMFIRHEGYELKDPAMWHAMVARSAYIAGNDDMMNDRLLRTRKSGPLTPQMERYLRRIGPAAEENPR